MIQPPEVSDRPSAEKPKAPHASGAAADLLPDRVISLAEAAHISGLSIDTLRRCSRRKELRILKLSPRRCGVRLSQLWAFIEGRAV
jgi:hypothetical protein